MRIKPRHGGLLSAAVWLVCVFTATQVFAACEAGYCNLATSEGVYQKIVIGKLVHIASDAEMAKVVHRARAHGYWQDLPDAAAPYQRDIKMVTIAPSNGAEPLTVFMMQREFEAAPLSVGALVRYHPHDPDWVPPENPVSRALYYGLTGCVATLCAEHDNGCQSQFKTGVFTLQGQQISPDSGEILAHGITINPISLRPVTEPAK